ncbi:hypothetical protein QOT17_005041 [Balamuthia mandrillaris]
MTSGSSTNQKSNWLHCPLVLEDNRLVADLFRGPLFLLCLFVERRVICRSVSLRCEVVSHQTPSNKNNCYVPTMNKSALVLVPLGLLATGIPEAWPFEDYVDEDDGIDINIACAINHDECRDEFYDRCYNYSQGFDPQREEACSCVEDWISCIDRECEITYVLKTWCEGLCDGEEEFQCDHPSLEDSSDVASEKDGSSAASLGAFYL